jgi:hypothetical protein
MFYFKRMSQTNKWKQELNKSTIERGTYVSKIGNKKACMLYCHNTNLAEEGVTKAKIVPSFWENR